jgi:hypothetical protein
VDGLVRAEEPWCELLSLIVIHPRVDRVDGVDGSWCNKRSSYTRLRSSLGSLRKLVDMSSVVVKVVILRLLAVRFSQRANPHASHQY